MRYKLTVLSPLLVGDGNRLSPIDYMVWKDQVNVLDQNRIFRLLAKGPRLDGYLQQLRKADKLDFATWGGFAQNFAGRRIPFEHASAAALWNKSRGETLFIPTFHSGPEGQTLPGSALKGALRSAMVFEHAEEGLKETAKKLAEDRGFRRVGAPLEDSTAGLGSYSRTRALAITDSGPAAGQFQVYLARTAVLLKKGEEFELGWKQAPRLTLEARRVEEATAVFAEMAAPGTVFEGRWTGKTLFDDPWVQSVLRWNGVPSETSVLAAANAFAAFQLGEHRKFAERARLPELLTNVNKLQARLTRVSADGRSCVLSLGWGTGYLSKAAVGDTESEEVRKVLREVVALRGVVSTGLPFPKTRKVLFEANQPAQLPGWVELSLS